jgi:hypothetical protein
VDSPFADHRDDVATLLMALVVLIAVGFRSIKKMRAGRHLARRNECVRDIIKTGHLRIRVEIPVAPGHLAGRESGVGIRRIGACRVGGGAGEIDKNVAGTVRKRRRPLKGIKRLDAGRRMKVCAFRWPVYEPPRDGFYLPTGSFGDETNSARVKSQMLREYDA